VERPVRPIIKKAKGVIGTRKHIGCRQKRLRATTGWISMNPTMTMANPTAPPIGLIWANVGPDNEPYAYSWLGLGLLSDNGLPFDCVQMFLAAKYLCLQADDGVPLKVLLADAHALTTGTVTDETVNPRAARREGEVKAISALLGIPCEVIRASACDADPDFCDILDEVRRLVAGNTIGDAEPPPGYIIRGIADVLYFNQDGGLKVGWSAHSDLKEGRGRNDEFGTDIRAAKIKPGVRAVYVRHGVTLDSKRPRAVPYTEGKDTSVRLMLTGKGRGNFKAKLNAENVSENRRWEVLEHVTVTVSAFEMLVRPLDGDGIIEKAEAIVGLLNYD
jgi:hypothetical protein